MPIQTAPGQGYGVASQQRAAQQAIPIAPSPVTTAPAAPAPSAPSPAPAAPNASAGPVTNPGDIDLLGPTERPNEPITAGVASGPGFGPDMTQGPGVQHQTVSDLINGLASHPLASPEIQELAQLVNRGYL